MSTKIDWYDKQRTDIEACCRQLVAEGIVEPLSTDEEETASWMLRELSSLIEGHLLFQLDIASLSEEARLVFERLVSYDGGPLRSPRGAYSRPFWLLAEGRRVGTISLGTMYSGMKLISISSLYVDPAERRRNLARHALEAVYRASLANDGGGIRLDTHWTWQPSVRFYARIGMWIWMWKHDLVFTWQPELPPYRVEIDGSEARFLIHQEDQWRAMVTARNLGDRLGWEPHGLENLPIDLSHTIPGTFALHLALAGWPLIRTEEDWEHRHHWCDAGDPEGLAYKIEIFEAVHRQQGFEVRAPRLPGLRYRELDEID